MNKTYFFLHSIFLHFSHLPQLIATINYFRPSFLKAKVSMLGRQVSTFLIKIMRIIFLRRRWPLSQKIAFSYKSDKKINFELKEPKLQNIVKLMAPAFQKSLKFNHLIINYGRIGFLKLDNAISLQQKKPFFYHFVTQNVLP